MKTKGSNSAHKGGAKTGKRPGTPVPTPDLDVTLAKRMKRRFSSRHGSSTISDLSTMSMSSSELSISHQSMLGASMTSIGSKGTNRRDTSRSKAKSAKSSVAASKKPTPSKLASATIDKYFIPEQRSTASSSPTSFQRSKVIDTDGEDEGEQTSGRDEPEKEKTSGASANGPVVPKARGGGRGTRKGRVDESPKRSAPGGASPDSFQGKPPSSSRRETSATTLDKSESQVGSSGSEPIVATRRSSKTTSPPARGSTATSSAPENGDPHRRERQNAPARPKGSSSGKSDNVFAPRARGEESGRSRSGQVKDVSQSHRSNRSNASSRFGQVEQSSSEDSRRRAVESSTGVDSDVSLAGQQFVHAQAKILAMPFTLEAGPGDWIEAWKRKNKSEEEEEEDDLPKYVVNRALSKLNKSMDALMKKKLSKTRQRDIFNRLVDARERDMAQGASVQAHLRQMEERMTTDPDGVLASYPETWSSATTEPDDLIEQYSSLRFNVSTMIDNSVADKQRLADNQMLLQSLQGLNTLDLPGSEELQEELERSLMLVAKVVEKLKRKKSRSSPRKKSSSGPRPLPDSHLALKALLFDVGENS